MKERIPQICETGLTAHYINEYAGAMMTIACEQTRQEVLDSLKRSPIRHYGDVIKAMKLDPEVYEVDLSSLIIPILNQTADYINERVSDESLDLCLFAEVAIMVEDMVRGFSTGKKVNYSYPAFS